MTAPSLTRRYAEFSSGLDWEDLSDPVREKALDLLADWMANAVAGYESDMGRALAEIFLAPPCSVLRPMGPEAGPGQSLVLGSLKPAQALEAAMVNGGASHALESDDAFRQGLFHPGAPVISAAWAAAGMVNAPGKRILTAVVAGYEVSMRLARAVNPGHNKIWHTTGTMGTLGAALAAAVCLGLDTETTVHALGLAGTQASGLWEILPDTPKAKGLHTAKAAHSGLCAALLARAGIKGPEQILEGPRGLFTATAHEGVNMAACFAGLGRDWEILNTTVKAYPVCGHTMTPIEAALKLHRGLDTAGIEEIEIRAHPVSISIAGNTAPKDGHQARFSIGYCVAAALSRGRVTTAEFLKNAIQDPKIQSLMEKTRIVPDDGLAKAKGQRPARITLILAGGRTLSETAHVRKGDPEYPMSREEIRTKFRNLVSGAWGWETGEIIYNSIGRLPDAREFHSWLNQNFLPWQEAVDALGDSKETR